MAELKTRPNDGDVEAFLTAVDHDRRREDAFTLLALLRRLTGKEPRMWGDSIVGFGEYPYTTRDGKEHRWFEIGFSPRKQNLTLYIMTGFDGYDDLMGRLGKHRTGVSCLYVNKLADVDMDVLEEIVRRSLDAVANRTTDDGLIR